MKIAVAGGTGLVGSKVVERLRRRGDDVVILARSTDV
ncbi:MAG: NAD-dependent epimerase/dehydratase family protein, partial [Catenulispora sp.]